MSIEQDIVLELAIERGEIEIWSIEKMISVINNEYMLYLVEHPLSAEDAELLAKWEYDITGNIENGNWWINERFFQQDVFDISLREMKQWQTEEDFDWGDSWECFENLFTYLCENKDPSYRPLSELAANK